MTARCISRSAVTAILQFSDATAKHRAEPTHVLAVCQVRLPAAAMLVQTLVACLFSVMVENRVYDVVTYVTVDVIG